MDNFSLILAPTIRSKCYLFYLKKNGLIPKKIFFLNSKLQRCKVKKHDLIAFDPQASFKNLFVGLKSEVFILKGNINSNFNWKIIKKQRIKYFIYSGLPGVILSKKFFGIDKTFIHVHGGSLPEYKGSTTFYYSILKREDFKVTSLILNPNIDSGTILIRKKFNLPKNIDIDYIYDPYTRSQVLIETIKKFPLLKKKNHNRIKDVNHYYVIHPVLKHIALKKCKLIKN